ncbi:hypothetical protein [Streptomyces sp. ALB3]|uniref:hypothetical protein n=1 Tax=Streptomyces sp. ALB3 TaxID=3374278 RepID=UPI0037A0958C
MRGRDAYGIRRPAGARGRGGPGWRPARAVTAALAVTVCAVLAAGCGIRSTSVPVDAGAAPSRVPCRASGTGTGNHPAGTLTLQVYLLCASQLLAVDRVVEMDESDSDRLGVARSLLAQLQQRPSADERREGFSTRVPEGLTVAGGLRDDPEGTLRLSEHPEDLPAGALAQLVCSFAESDGFGDPVLLGGPGEYRARSYACTPETRARPADGVGSRTAAP